MEEKELKTSVGQRIAIIVIAVIMLGSIIAGYAAIVINGNKNSSANTDTGTTEISEERMKQYEDAYNEKLATFKTATAGEFAKFSSQLSVMTAYNETAANSGGVQTVDLIAGDGRELAEGDNNYLAFYAGWCADESVFDSSLDSTEKPTAFSKALDASLGLIEGWNAGMVGMKLGGVREITVPGELAYGDKMEICGGYNKPLKFLVMAVANEDPLKSLSKEVDMAFMKLQYAKYGIDYDAQMNK
ncbi:FKBP-type peptidyl-prolyl cis-trans isomerase [Candidatus Saccharibacteria bacterium]|nr:FKBP-type peptidyl-prolyl cis-trans isomerase [Candidatus Saccharibacteria bacterium]